MGCVVCVYSVYGAYVWGVCVQWRVCGLCMYSASVVWCGGGMYVQCVGVWVVCGVCGCCVGTVCGVWVLGVVCVGVVCV